MSGRHTRSKRSLREVRARGAGDSQRARRSVSVVQRSLAAALVLAVLVVAGAGVVAFVVLREARPTGLPCTATVDGRSYGLDRDQVANAQTIRQTATGLGLPDHAVTVALAAAFQESALHNVAHGDRDSVGLFQQRPSQGWGTPAQLLDPSYASAAFLRALSRVPGWAAMPVATAAQSVQHSATPAAYATWEAEARALARAVTGEVPGALTCRTG
jgi:hypothetical protein